jgi:hypothetical protein
MYSFFFFNALKRKDIKRRRERKKGREEKREGGRKRGREGKPLTSSSFSIPLWTHLLATLPAVVSI